MLASNYSMNKLRIDGFRKKLNLMQEKDQSTLKSLLVKKEDLIEAGHIADLEERSSINEDFYNVSSSINRLKEKISNNKKAMLKIENGTFGFCEDAMCGEEIEQLRIEHNPELHLCASCAYLEYKRTG